MVQKVWSSICINIPMIILITIIFRVIIMMTDIIVVCPKVWQEECNWKEYPALSMVQVSRLPGDAMMMVSGVAAAGAVDTKFFTLDPSTPKVHSSVKDLGRRVFEVAITSAATPPLPVKEETRLPIFEIPL